MPTTISSRDYFAQPKKLRETRGGNMQRDLARMLRLVPRSRKGQGRKNESGLILVSHAIAPSHDDVRTTMHDHARRGLRHSRRHRRATGDIPPPIRDDGSKPIRDGFHATSARRAIYDARPNRRNDHSDPHKLPPARRRTAQSERHRREMFEVSLLIPPSKRAMLGNTSRDQYDAFAMPVSPAQKASKFQEPSPRRA